MRSRFFSKLGAGQLRQNNLNTQAALSRFSASRRRRDDLQRGQSARWRPLQNPRPNRYRVTAAAALKTLDMRRADPAGYVREVFPNVDAAWRAATSPDGNDPAAYQVAIARSIAAQEQLDFEIIQPLPNSFSADPTNTLDIRELLHHATDTGAGTLDASTDASEPNSGSGQRSEALENQQTQAASVIYEQNENIYPSVEVAGISKSVARNLCIDFCTNATLPTGTYDGAPFHYCMARCMENYGH